MPKTFGPHARLRNRADFMAVQNGGRRVATRLFTMLARPNTLGHDRLGIIASRRVGGAVSRNRAKRRLREIFRQHPGTSEPPAGRSFDVVVIARPEMVGAPFGKLQSDFHTALEKLRSSR